MHHTDPFSLIREFSVHDEVYSYYSLPELTLSFPQIRTFPYTIRILIESALRSINGREITEEDVRRMLNYDPENPEGTLIPFMPARVLMQDFTGVPCLVDLAALRSALSRMGKDPARINPALPVDLIIDHSVSVDCYGRPDALEENARLEFKRNHERYGFLKWGEKAFDNLTVFPPARGICHQVNLEYLGTVTRTKETDGRHLCFFDTLVGTDSHTPMINGLGVLGWGVGGIEAEAALLGQPLVIPAPGVVGVRLTGSIQDGSTATDLVLHITQLLRSRGVVGKIVEFFGPGVGSLSVPDRATLGNMAPEYGATAGYFPVDERTMEYMYATGRDERVIERARRYMSVQELFGGTGAGSVRYEAVLDFDISTVVPSVAGPKRPQDRIDLSQVSRTFRDALSVPAHAGGYEIPETGVQSTVPLTLASGEKVTLSHGSVVIAAITSCTNTSNPSVLMAAGLLARKAVELGMRTPPHVKTSFAPGSVVTTAYLSRAGLMPFLEELGFHLVGYGCTTCIGNSGPLDEEISRAVREYGLVTASVLSGNRNFEGRINPDTRANFLASPPLCVAYALAGSVNVNLASDPVGHGSDGRPVYLADIWPEQKEIDDYIRTYIDRDSFIDGYRDMKRPGPEWEEILDESGLEYDWKEHSTYIQEPPFFTDFQTEAQPVEPITGARVLVKVGASVTTDHISPAGFIDPNGTAGKYLCRMGVNISDYNSYGSRRGNDRIMIRGTFANIRLRNQLLPGTEGSVTVHFPSGEVLSIYDASLRYREAGTPTIVLAGTDYGMGSSRDWAAKGVYLLGIRAVIAESFERIHRSNLVCMGVLPLEFYGKENAESLGLSGTETYTIHVHDGIRPGETLAVDAVSGSGTVVSFTVRCRIDSGAEYTYYRNGGILQTVLRNMIREE
ncbi:MAG: aconitate hydratase AcnA [Spirochaetota bacterium]